MPPTPALYNYVNCLGTWNVRGINGTVKREEVLGIFKEGKFELFALMEMKLKGNGEFSWYRVNGVIGSVQEMERIREGVAILLNNVGHSAVADFGCVSSRILWIKLKFSRVIVSLVVGYGPYEGDEERDRF